MNANERTHIPPPRGCITCQEYIETGTSYSSPRYECATGHPMHEMCGWRKPKIETVVIKL